jgi:O-antigen/teichoic acid export membrane protein
MSTLQIEISRKLVAQRFLFGVLAYALMRIKGLVTLPIMTRLLGPEGMGAVSMAGVTASMLWPVLTLGMTNGLPVRIVNATDTGELRKTFGSAVNVIMGVTVVFLGAVLALRGLGIAQELIDRFAPYLLATILYVVASLVKELVLLVPKVLQRTKLVVAFELIMDYGGALAAIGVLYAGMGPEQVIWALGTVLLVTGAILFTRVVREFGYYLGIDGPLVRSLLVMGLPVVPVSLAQWALQGIDNYFIVYHYGQAAQGVYAVAYAIANLTLALLTVLNYVFFPTLATLLKRGKEPFEAFLCLTIRLVTLVLGLWLLVTVLLGRDAIALLAGPGYEGATELIPPVVLGYIGLTVSNLLQTVPLAMAQRTLHMTYSYGASMLLNVALNFLLIPRYGLAGAAYATMISYLLLLVFMVIAAAPYLNRGYLIRNTLIGWVPVAVLYPAAVWGAKVIQSVGQRVGAAFLCALVFAGVSWVSGALSHRDIAAVRSWEGGA